MNYTSGSHTVFHHRYYIVWITKYRYNVLEGALRERIRTITREHVHMFVEIPPHIAVSGSCARQGTVIASGADGVSGLAQALLGAAFLGLGLLLHHQRQHYGRCHTSVSSGARTHRHQPVVIQFRHCERRLDEAIDPTRSDIGRKRRGRWHRAGPVHFCAA
jgi:hypothetical protein